ncbi:MAG: GNAT family N-acetyltransferase [Candidatus Heimdallarchaeota archaeon]|nr:MAG: GNAT family N-acetyltransferase [Candidatus Heimdallarchaeota archaeon]
METKIRQYHLSDEEEWIQCHSRSYFDSIYFDEQVKAKPRYETPSVELVGIHDGKIIGILDIEIEQEHGQFCFDETERSGMISVIGVLSHYRRKGIGTKLIEKGMELIQKNYDVHRIEIWVREDPTIKSWLEQIRFQEIHRFYEVLLTTDFFEKYHIDLPFGIMPVFLTGNLESEGFSKLTQQHPPERSFPILIYERYF